MNNLNFGINLGSIKGLLTPYVRLYNHTFNQTTKKMDINIVKYI